MFFILQVLSALLCITRVYLIPTEYKESNVTELEDSASVSPACVFKIVGSQGSIYSPHLSKPNTTCVWNIDVMKGYVAVLKFEHFKLPIIKDQPCEFYVEISYKTEDDSIKKKVCPTEEVDTINTTSQKAVVRYHFGRTLKDYQTGNFGFKINYSGNVPEKPKSQLCSNCAVMIILLLSVAIMLSVALCLFCYRCRLYGRYSRGNTNEGPQEPNAPTRQQLEETFIVQRNALQGLQSERKKMNFSIFQSQGSSYNSSLHRWASNPHLPEVGDLELPRSDGKTVSIMTTPRSVFPELRRKWSENSVQRIEHLRTKLVARFSSTSNSNHNTSDISVFFPASERRAYSQLNSEDDREIEAPVTKKEPEEKPKDDNTPRRIRNHSEIRRVPSIVIEFVE